MTATIETTGQLGQPAIERAEEQADDLRLWSVTTILGVLDKPALLYWSAAQTAESAIDNQATWQALLDDRGRDEAVKWLRDARFRKPRNKLSAAALGTAVHGLCESYALTGTRPDRDATLEAIQQQAGRTPLDSDAAFAETDVAGHMLARFDEWLQRFSPSYQATEVTVYSPTYGIAGTCDGFLTIDGTRLVIDYKTSREPFDSRGDPKRPYPEVALQLAAYRFAEAAAVWRPRRSEKYRRRYYLLSPAERELAQPVPEVDGAAVIHITPTACEAYPVRADQSVHTTFLHLLEAARWRFSTEQTVIGSPLEAPHDHS